MHVLYAMWNELPEEDRAKVWKEKRNKWTIASKDLKERWKIDLAPEDIKKHAGVISERLPVAEGPFDMIKMNNHLAEKYPEVGLTSDMAAQYGAKILGEQATHALADNNKKQDILISYAKELGYLKDIHEQLVTLVNVLTAGKKSKVKKAAKFLDWQISKASLVSDAADDDDESEESEELKEDDEDEAEEEEEAMDEGIENISLTANRSANRLAQEIEKKKKEKELDAAKGKPPAKKQKRLPYA